MIDVGVVGLGIMGTAMSGHLIERGFRVIGFDPVPSQRDQLAAAGGQAADSLREVSEAARVLITSLPTPDAAQSVCKELAEFGAADSIVVETSTLSMKVKDGCREELAAAGIVLLDCPLSGTGAQAKLRDVVVFGSGDKAAFESVRQVLEAFSRSVRYLGPFGHGSIMKYVANLLVAVHNVSTAEAFALGVRAGLNPTMLYEAVRDGAGGSVIFDKRGKLMINENYLPATARVSMFVKDVSIVRDYAQTLDLPTPLLDRTVELYDRAMAAGLADSDAAALLSLMKSDHISESCHDSPQP